MTFLSILLWIIDIAGSFKIVGATFAVILIIVALASLAIGAIKANDGSETAMAKGTRLFKHMMIYGVVLGFVSLAIPSKPTLYMIVGVEAANAVITNEHSKEIMLEIKQVVLEKIKETSLSDAASLAKDAKKLAE